MGPRHLVTFLAILMVWGVSCFRQAAPPPAPSPLPVDAPIPAGATQVAKLAKEHLAKEKGLNLTTIRVVEVQAVDWPDTSLGCPQPGMMYAQVITPGYRIVLSDGTTDYEYHSDASTRVILCSSSN